MRAVLLCAIATAAEPFPAATESLASGARIDWTELRLDLTATSEITVGAWKDRRVQEQDALDRIGPGMRNLAEGVCVTPDTTAGDLMAGSSELAARLQEDLRAWTITEARYKKAGGVELDARLDLRAWLRPALVGLATKHRREGSAAEVAGHATGVVVDARGLRFSPCLAPTVTVPDGTAVVRAQLLNEETANLSTPVVYVTDPADPRAWRRAGDFPFFARATTARGQTLVLDPTSAASLPPEVAALVAAGRVVVVVDP